LQRQTIRRRHPAASDAEIEALLGAIRRWRFDVSPGGT
jgi:hypothetical protein